MTNGNSSGLPSTRKSLCGRVKRSIAIAAIALLVSSCFVLAQEHDNRIKASIKVGDSIRGDVPEVYPTEDVLRTKIGESRPDVLDAVVGKSMSLKWIRRVALHDADYILCLFDSSTRVEPGTNSRVLLLFTPDYQLKTWGIFRCEPAFASGHLVSPLTQPNTWFITVNASGRFGGTLSFEKYLVQSDGIRKLGENHELTKIPNQ